MNTFSLFLVAFMGAISCAQAETSLIPIEAISGSIAPYVDKDGYVNPIISLGQIDFGGGLSLPLVLNFSSAIRAASPEFGQGWECPLFEARIVDVQEGLKRMETLGGKDRYLIFDARTNCWKHFFTDDWKGIANGDEFDLTYKNGCEFIFHKGRISSVVSSDGRTILWNRSGDKLVSLQESGKPPALTIAYDELGFAKKILLNPDSMGESRLDYEFTPDLVYAGLKKVQCPGGRIICFDQSKDEALNPVAKWTDTFNQGNTLSWDPKTGKIIKDDKFSYQISEINDDRTWPKMDRQNIINGTHESYFFDEKRGIMDQTLPDGTLRHTEIIQAPGPNYKATRLIQETKGGIVFTVFRQAFDDRGNLLLEAIGLTPGKEQVRQFTYDSENRVVSYIFNGKTKWENIYDASTGRLIRRLLPELDTSIDFEALPGGEIKECISHVSGGGSQVTTISSFNWTRMESALQSVQ